MYINNFWNDIFTPLVESGDKHLMIMVKVQFNDESLGYRTLGDLRRVNFNDRDLFIEYLSARLDLLNESYFTHPISKITFTYIIKQGLATGERRLLQDLTLRSNTSHRYNNINLPISMNPSDFGNVIVDKYIQLNGKSIHRIIIDSGTKTFQFDINSDSTVNEVTMLGAFNLKWKDIKISDNTIQREIGKSTMYFLNGERILIKKQLNAKPITNLPVDTKLESNFITMDTETVNNGGKLTPYLICAYNGIDYITSYANENFDQKALFSEFINQLVTFFNKDSNILTVYAHNLSGFDGIFLIKQVLNFGKVIPLLNNNGKILSITVRLNIDGYKGKSLVFKDSYLLLPHSLRILCKAFNIVAPKGHFPFLLNDIFYKGVIPRLELWTGLELADFIKLVKEYTNIEWNFKDEAIKYCKLDCSSLHEILTQFNQLMFNEFKVNIKNSLTLPSLAMKIYKIHFMPKNTIYQLLGKPEQDIRESYTGGAVDVYKPHNRVSSFFSKIKSTFIKLYCYDVNSLYPFIMSSTIMPIGKPIAFNGDIRNIDPQAFGFFYCKITLNKYLEHPILQRRIKTSDGMRTIAGLGTWEGWIYSPEMDNAIKYGYTFEIINGYQFEKGNIFISYINTMYNLRLQYPRGNAMNLIAKLLMNSLYGKFGMKLDTTSIEMFNTSNDTELEQFKEALDTYGESITDFVQIGNHYLTIRKNLIDYQYAEVEDMYHGLDVNVAIASAITAGGRMWMSLFKNNPKYNIYYSDTDSWVIDSKLPENVLGPELGKFKLEYVINKAVFLAPKVYALVLEDGTEIIKIKGVSKDLIKDINFNNIQDLLIKDSIKEFNQQKWYKDLLLGEISVIDTAYSLKVTSNKRKVGYITQEGVEIFNSTKPYNYNEIIKK